MPFSMLLMYECYEYRCNSASNLLKFMCNSQGPILLMLSILQSVNTDANDASLIKYKLNLDFKRFLTLSNLELI